jgi:enolase
VVTEKGLFRASVPSGASTGSHEALEKRDGDKSRFKGKGVLTACANARSLGKSIVGMDERDSFAVDSKLLELDGTDDKSKMGANAILGISVAVCKAAAAAKGVPLYRHFADLAGNQGELVLPVPSFNVINGGSHAGNGIAFQEFMILPTGAESFSKAMQMGAEIYQILKGVTKDKYGQDAVNVGDEGGFAPPVGETEEALDLLISAIDKSGYKNQVAIGLDVAASEFRTQDSKYDVYKKNKDGHNKPKYSADEMVAMYARLCDRYPIVSMEDPFDQDDWESWTKLNTAMHSKVQIVGDDLTVTNPKRIATAIKSHACSALLLKVNQIGSIKESIEAVKLAKSADWGVMASHRSGETEDTYIADLAVGLCTGQIKTGAPCRSERLAKYNQLLRIEEELTKQGTKFSYAGQNFRRPEKKI